MCLTAFLFGAPEDDLMALQRKYKAQKSGVWNQMHVGYNQKF